MRQREALLQSERAILIPLGQAVAAVFDAVGVCLRGDRLG